MLSLERARIRYVFAYMPWDVKLKIAYAFIPGLAWSQGGMEAFECVEILCFHSISQISCKDYFREKFIFSSI